MTYETVIILLANEENWHKKKLVRQGEKVNLMGIVQGIKILTYW